MCSWKEVDDEDPFHQHTTYYVRIIAENTKLRIKESSERKAINNRYIGTSFL